MMLNTMGQQLAVMLGISISALVVDASARASGRVDPAAVDFALAFGLVALVALSALPQVRIRPRKQSRVQINAITPMNSAACSRQHPSTVASLRQSLL